MLHHFWTAPDWGVLDWGVLAQCATVDREMLAILGVSLLFGATFYLVASDRVGTLRARARDKPAA